MDLSQPAAALQSQKVQPSPVPLQQQNNSIQAAAAPQKPVQTKIQNTPFSEGVSALFQVVSDQLFTPVFQPVEPAETPTAPTVTSPPSKAEVQPQAQPTAPQQTAPPSVVGTAAQQAGQTPSSPAPPQRPARRKQPGPAQQQQQQQLAQTQPAVEAETVSCSFPQHLADILSEAAFNIPSINRLLLRLPRQPKATKTN